MFLTAYNLPHYLLSKGLVDSQSLVSGDFAVVEAGRRNRNFKVLRRNSVGLFVKQIKTTEPQAIHTIQREAAFYRAVHSDPKYAALRHMLPEFVDYDERRYALTLRLADNAESIQERQMRESKYGEDTARLLGQALALVHSHAAAMASDSSTRALFTYQLPWPLTFDQAGYQMLNAFGAIGPALATGIQQFPNLQPLLSSLRAEWRYDSLVHNDMKWDNCLLKTQPETEPQLTLVDWELVDIGDGCWDVGTIFKEYIMAALMNSSAREQAAAQKYPAPPEVTLETLRPSARAFWEAYTSARALSGLESHTTLLRTIRLTAGRMIVSVLEYLGGAPELGPFGNTMLQTAAALLQAPQVAMAQLLGSQPLAAAA